MRWRDILVSPGHRVDVSTDYSGRAADLKLALHAWRSASAIRAFVKRASQKPLVVALTGTDA